jgi:RHS repeat-associated protein
MAAEDERVGAKTYRPGRWGDFREDYGFTGKEEDVEVGLVYFGKRFYAPGLQRWVSADPLETHRPGEAEPNVYAYVDGRALLNTDPAGLCGPLCGMAVGAGAGALVGGIVGGGVELIAQLNSDHDVVWGDVGANALGGAVSGGLLGMAAAVPGLGEASVLAAATWLGTTGAASSVIGTIATKAVSGEGPSDYTATDAKWDVGTGVLSGWTAGLGKNVVKALRQSTEESLAKAAERQVFAETPFDDAKTALSEAANARRAAANKAFAGDVVEGADKTANVLRGTPGALVAGLTNNIGKRSSNSSQGSSNDPQESGTQQKHAPAASRSRTPGSINKQLIQQHDQYYDAKHREQSQSAQGSGD